MAYVYLQNTKSTQEEFEGYIPVLYLYVHISAASKAVLTKAPTTLHRVLSKHFLFPPEQNTYLVQGTPTRANTDHQSNQENRWRTEKKNKLQVKAHASVWTQIYSQALCTQEFIEPCILVTTQTGGNELPPQTFFDTYEQL